ncbi:UDP-N-acetylmuramate--L-alanine ligase [Thermosynechococcaceae cyanobacterium BACA0444]|uniref:UDP-N-acetylmuramate--L-alanine ligase n=1 Tax=Pseudocalidococcus azoricus BACA0444 TaxID=2918990 RepID=A0AAE4FS69_9CYAN|nr:UDP-N-acetylmuramate--L-alanine ligase [Pseudocalidococcus azoricus]MDS3861136.1 UDP-N-acetylmuramate--L-alanine ligase [Pseudocalidococcus azoricus BACA0444]
MELAKPQSIPMSFNGRPFHFIGIGGIGMSALAYILAKQKFAVSGSDLRATNLTHQLQAMGVTFFEHQVAENLTDYPARTGHRQLPQVICSTAIRENNPEFQAAQALGCPIFHRSDILAALIERSQGIAVAGTHGKTTTSSMVGYVLLEGGLDPTIVVGGEVAAWQGNARIGDGSHLVAEADESDGSLQKFAPRLGVITNIELDHPDHYQTLDQVVAIFAQFAQQSQGLVVCWDCPTVRERLNHKNLITYSLRRESGADYTVDHVQYGANGTTAHVSERGKSLGILQLKLLGAHNLQNALAAIAVGREVSLDFATISAALAKFEGARRRFEERGQANGVRFIDDYAHHPSEIQVTLQAGRLQVGHDQPWRRLVAVFQPHRYSRTFTFLEEFSQSFQAADVVVITDIYSAGEPDQGLVEAKDLVNRLSQYHPHVSYAPTATDVRYHLRQVLSPGDLVIFLGAGNLNQLIPDAIADQVPSPVNGAEVIAVNACVQVVAQ